MLGVTKRLRRIEGGGVVGGVGAEVAGRGVGVRGLVRAVKVNLGVACYRMRIGGWM